MSFRSSFLRTSALTCAILATAATPALFAQSSSSADYDAQASSSINTPSNVEFRTQYQNQYPSGGGYHQYKGGDSTFSHIAVEGGFGFSVPLGKTSNTVNELIGPSSDNGGFNEDINLNTTGYNLLLGGGWNFNKHFAAMVEYRFEDLGINNSLLNLLATECGTTNCPYGVTGNSHLWSLSVNPVYNFKTKGKWGGYATGGAGFYRDLTSFNTPVLEYYDSFFGIIPEEGSALLDHYSSNQAGFNAGGGLTWKPNPDQHGALFADIRYEWVNTPGNTTSTLPVTFGYRW
jgi:opacity protein-like surface antigen